jgi:N-methylhydantoinase A
VTYRVGIDIGGTFTDCVAIDRATGVVRTAKARTTPDDQSVGLLNALDGVGLDMADIDLLLHGCTVGLNAVLTRTGAKTGLITTSGFRDVLAMGRGQRPASDQFNPRWRRAFGDGGMPFCPRYLRRTIDGRIDSSGTEIVPLDEDAIQREVEFLVTQGVESIAICFVNAYANDAHERRAHELVRSIAPEVHCSTSTAVHPCFKEYPRFSTAVLNAYTGPLVSDYLGRAEELLKQRAYGGTFMIMQSNGGVLPATLAKERPISTLQSGPTGGVIAAQYWGMQLGVSSLLTFDVGGTSADLAVIQDGRPIVTTELEVEHDVVVAVPAVDVHSIGAGGGSVAWIDPIGALRVGPRSAGADPGPAAYGRGGSEPTVTDALAVIGVLNPNEFMQGTFPFDPELARVAMQPIANQLRLTLEQAAQAVIDIADSAMVEAAREVSVYNGIDPRDFVLYVYGAAGPLFASHLTRQLGVSKALIAPNPGEMSAFGMALADLRLDLGRPVVRKLGDITPGYLESLYVSMELEARKILERDDVVIARWLDGRYAGQTWETPSVSVPDGSFGAAEVQQVRRNFDETHERMWGYSLGNVDVKVTMVRVTATVDLAEPEWHFASDGALDGSDAPRRDVFLDNEWRSVPVVPRAELRVGATVEGPALITQPTSTLLLNASDEARIDASRHLWLTCDRRDGAER